MANLSIISIQPTLPQKSAITLIHWRLGIVVILFAFSLYFFSPQIKKRLVEWKKERSRRKMYLEINQQLEEENTGLRDSLEIHMHRTEMLEDLTQSLEREKRTWISFARDLALQIIPKISTVEQSQEMKGMFERFEGQSMEIVPIVDELKDKLAERNDELVDEILRVADSDKEKDPK